MHTYYEVKDMLKRELENITRRGEITDRNIEVIDTLLNSIKNACKIIMYEEYAEEDGGYSYEGGYSSRGGYSNARGRGRNAKRDSMGRYSREGGYSNDGGYSNRRDGRYSRDGGYSYPDGGYSYADDGKEEKMQMLRELMSEASSEEEKEMIKSLMQHVNK